jgi:MFS family permease
MPKNQRKNMSAFTVIWVGQVFSLLGTSMTRFALTVWAWLITGEATALALVGFFSYTPTVLVSPFAGALVDRWNRKLVMMLSDLAAGISTIFVLILFVTGNLQIWHLYVTGAFSGAFLAFQFPAYSATITMLVSKDHYGRASGMLSMARYGSSIFAPVLASILLGIIGIDGILSIDVITLLVAISMLLLIHIPQPKVTEEGRKSKGNLWKETIYGFRYIFERSSLLALQLLYFFIMLFVYFAIVVMSPMILARTGNDVTVLGIVESAFGIGGMVGSVVLSVWGGPKRRINGVFIGFIFAMLGLLLMGLGRDPFVWVLAAFFTMFFVPILDGSDQAIWQSKVAPDVQGRVFGSRLLISEISAPVSMLLAGPLADRVFEPAMMQGGSLVAIFGGLIGTGPGAGMALIFVFAGALGILIGLIGFSLRVVRNVEDILPDHKAEAKSPNDT